MENWQKVGRNSNYSVSDSGQVRRDDTNHIKEPRLNRYGYDVVDLYKNGNRQTERIHRLVAEAFIPNPDNKPEVNHKDGNKRNNHISNLEWATKRENIDHAVKHGLRTPSYGMRGKKNPNGGAHGKPVRVVETGEIFKNIKECSVCKNCRAIGITNCLHGRQHTHRGMHFEFA